MLAQIPEVGRLGIGLRDGRVAREAVAEALAQRRLDLGRQRRICRRVVRLEEHVPIVSGQSIGQGGKVSPRERDAGGGDELEPGETIAERLPRRAEQANRGRHVSDGNPSGG